MPKSGMTYQAVASTIYALILAKGWSKEEAYQVAFKAVNGVEGSDDDVSSLFAWMLSSYGFYFKDILDEIEDLSTT